MPKPKTTPARTPRFGIKDGWLHPARHVPSPNFNTRPAGAKISLLVVHSISLPPGQYGGPWIDNFFQNKLDADADPFFKTIADMKVSSHMLIRRDGEAVQYVSFDARAWHAGISTFDGVSDCNNFSIGIELEGCDSDGYEAAQYKTLAAVTKLLRKHYPRITSKRIAGHCDIAPGRKTDPGPHFDWKKYRTLLASKKRAAPPKKSRNTKKKTPLKKSTIRSKK